MDLMTIKDPKDIKDFSIKELEQLNEEIRQFLIKSISKTGGHLGSSLGTIELITALHYEFDSPKDKIVFDVGHQAYGHKILTGRINEFSTLRQYKGLSGFLKRSESEHDVWESGHSSNSISAAIGYAMQRDLDGQDNHVVCLIGDGSMTNGMSLEALNHLIEINKKVIIIINDNEMSISPNIGFIDKMFKNLEINKSYDGAKKVIRGSIDKIDGSHKTTDFIRSFKNKIKSEINTSKGFFNLLGFKYLGPIDGHDTKELISVFKTAKNYDKPIILHVKTIKGKGYAPAEKNSWHGVNKFDISTGKIQTTDKISNSKIVSTTLQSIMEEDEDLVIISPAMIAGSELKQIEQKFPSRITDVGIAEEHAASLAAGLALAGKKPFLTMYSTFLQRAYDQIFQDIVRQDCDVVIGIDRAGLVGADGETHQGIYDISFLSHMPNVTIMQGKDAGELKSLIRLAFEIKGPMFIRYSRHGQYTQEEAEKKNYKIKYGTWEVLQKGNKINIISYGEDVVKLQEEFKNHEDVGIINARFIKPLDRKVLNEIKDKQILVLEEHARIGGLGSLILDYYANNDIKANVKVQAIDDNFVEHGDILSLKKEQAIDISSVVANVKSLLKE